VETGVLSAKSVRLDTTIPDLALKASPDGCWLGRRQEWMSGE